MARTKDMVEIPDVASRTDFLYRAQERGLGMVRQYGRSRRDFLHLAPRLRGEVGAQRRVRGGATYMAVGIRGDSPSPRPSRRKRGAKGKKGATPPRSSRRRRR